MLKVAGFAVLTFLAVWCPALSDHNKPTEANLVGAPPKRDRFRIIQTNVASEDLQDQIEDFTSYGCESMVVITNDAQDALRLMCATNHDKTNEVEVPQGESFIFTFRPQKGGKSFYWCTVEYNYFYARFDVYNEGFPYMCPRANENVYRYSVRHDGVYANGENKIRSLAKGHNKFEVWENFDVTNNQTDGLLVVGFVEGGMCNVFADHFNDRASAVTICDHQCVIMYEHYNCVGYSRKLQATDGCSTFQLLKLNKEASSIKGC